MYQILIWKLGLQQGRQSLKSHGIYSFTVLSALQLPLAPEQAVSKLDSLTQQFIIVCHDSADC